MSSIFSARSIIIAVALFLCCASSMSAQKADRYKAIGGGFLFGYSALEGSKSSAFNNPISFGINLDYQLGKLIFHFEDHIGFHKAQRDIIFPNNEVWEINQNHVHLLVSLALGTPLLDNQMLKLVPNMGIGAESIFPLSEILGSGENSQFVPNFKLGCFIDLRSVLIGANHPSFNDSTSYSCLRISFDAHLQIGNPKMPQFFGGNTYTITLGMGGFAQ